MQEVYTIAIAAAAVVAVSAVGRILGNRARQASAREGALAEAPAEGRADDGQAAAGSQLIAVIAAAVSAASGMDTRSFRVVGFRPSPAPSAGAQIARTGLNTPVWGHVERFNRGE